MGITGRAFLVGLIAVLIGFMASGPAEAAPITGGTGPGGVGLTDGSSDLAVWLKADALLGSIGDGASVGGSGSEWTDASGSGNHGATTYSDRRPVFRSSGSRLLNGNPIVEFDGTGDRLFLGSPILTLTDLGSNISAFTVTKLDLLKWRNTVFSGYDGGSGGFSVDIPGDGSPAERYRLNHRNADGSASRVHFTRGPSTPSLTNPDLISVVSGPSAIEMRLNGSVEVSNTYSNANPTPNDRMVIGGIDLTSNDGNPFDGSFAEVIAFSTNVNAAERILIENYLQAKYNDSTADNMTIADDKYAGDTTAAGDYDRDVFGIGRVDSANQLTNSGSAGLGIEASGTLTDGQFVMAGHKVQNNSLTSDDVPPDCWKRWDRVWFVDETNELSVDLQMAFDFSDAGLDASGSLFDLLYSPTNAFDFEMLGLSATVDGDLVTFTLPAAMVQDGYYTLGMVPEPSSAALLILGLTALGPCGWRKRRARIT